MRIHTTTNGTTRVLGLAASLVLALGGTSQEAAPPAHAEVEALALGIEEAAARRDSAPFDALVSHRMLFERVTQGLPRSAAFRSKYREGMERMPPFSRGAVQDLGAVGSYRCVGLRSAGESPPTAIFRRIDAAGSLDYHELHFARSPEGELRVDDVLVYARGEWMSETLRASLVAVDAASPREREEISRLKQLGEMEDPARALKELAELSEATKRSKMGLLQRVKIARKVSQEEHFAALEAMGEVFSDDPLWLVLGLAPLIQRGRLDEALGNLDRLEALLGVEDPYLDALRASIVVLQGDLAGASELVESAVGAEPTLQQSWNVLLVVRLREKDWDALAADLTLMERALGVEMDPERSPLYAEFVASDAYRAWKAARAGR